MTDDRDIIARIETQILNDYLNRGFEDDEETCELCECSYSVCSCSPRDLRMFHDPDAELGGHDNPYDSHYYGDEGD